MNGEKRTCESCRYGGTFVGIGGRRFDGFATYECNGGTILTQQEYEDFAGEVEYDCWTEK